MLRWFRRFLWLGVLGGVGAACYTVWQRRQAEPAEPRWPPIDPTPLHLVGDGTAPTTFTETAVASESTDVAAANDSAPDTGSATTDTLRDEATRWVPPVDGACPAGHPVKGKATSGIYHVPGGRFYERTVPDRCYASAADAEADGYRAARS
jgi:hypothetical protein